MNAVAESSVVLDPDKIRLTFHELLAKTNKERPKPADIKALTNLLNENKELQLWRAVVGMGALAEDAALKTILGDQSRGQGSLECWKRRLETMRKELGYASGSPLEQLLIQQVTLCWLNLNLTEYRHINVMKQSITLTLGIYWEKRLTAAQRRFTRACESLARVRRLSRRIPVQVNIATRGGQQINMAGGS